jgi:RimJ/RimL family protein N-acetyltransferase
MILHTPRLLLRPWTDADREPMAAINADPEVMRHFARPLSRTESDRCVDLWQLVIEECGWGLWAVQRRQESSEPQSEGGGSCIGFIGLAVPSHVLPFMPCVEIGWRLARAHWGAGLASEGARAVLAFGFDALGLEEIVSFTALTNLRSQAVMARIGMHNTGEDFDHPALPEGHALRRHCLYRLRRSEWKAAP